MAYRAASTFGGFELLLVGTYGIDRCTYGTSTIWYRTVGTYGTVSQ